MRYNPSEAYALAIGHFADRLRGGQPFVQQWPRDERVLSRDEAWGGRLHLRVSFSAGLTAWRPGETLRDALARADHALYEAKASGRDRLVER